MRKKRQTKPENPKTQTPAMYSPADLALAGYAELLASIKRRVQTAQVRAAVAVNRELVLLYWQIGHDILRRQPLYAPWREPADKHGPCTSAAEETAVMGFHDPYPSTSLRSGSWLAVRGGKPFWVLLPGTGSGICQKNITFF